MTAPLTGKMASLDLRYGHASVTVEFDEAACDILAGPPERPPLSDLELGARLDSPIGSPRCEEIFEPGESVLFVVPDATRQTATGQVINLLVRRLIANGTAPSEMAVIFATGIHRPVTETEKEEILTPFIAQRLRTIQHDAAKAIRLYRVGETSGGIPVELNWTLQEFDRVILIGGVTAHYFAGFTGGRKLICPGLASERTIAATHKLAFDCDRSTRSQGVGPGRLDQNPVNAAFEEAAAMAEPDFCISTIVNASGAAVELFCGDRLASHRAACEAYAATHTVSVAGRRPLVIASCGGYPNDINLIQAHKSLEAASRICSDGGTIVLIAECGEGLGRHEMSGWFDMADSRQMAERLCSDYQVNGQTAWSIRSIAERFDVRLYSELDKAMTERMGMRKLDRADPLCLGQGQAGYIIPRGARWLYSQTADQ